MAGSAADHELAGFARAAGVESSALHPVAGDASGRRYWRASGTGWLIMEDPGAPESFSAFLRVAAHLAGLGLASPRIGHTDTFTCRALVEDFGEDVFTRLLDLGEPAGPLLLLAVEALRKLHGHPDAANFDAPRQTSARLLADLAPFYDWFIPSHVPERAQQHREAVDAAWAQALSVVDTAPQTLVLRDFHAGNLVRRADGTCGLLDFQDAMIGVPEYDLASLVQDARRDYAVADIEATLNAYFKDHSPDDTAAAMARFHAVAAQRHARILGVFLRLAKRDEKPGYLVHVPRVKRQLRGALSTAGMKPVQDALDRFAPGWDLERPDQSATAPN